MSLFSGILNSIARFTAAAFAPALLNLAMLTALIFVQVGGTVTAIAVSIAVTVGGVLQLAPADGRPASAPASYSRCASPR